MNENDAILLMAKEYVARGWFVIPLHSVSDTGGCTCDVATCTDIGKHPRTARGLKDGSRDLAQLGKWFGPNAPLSNIGIVTGEISNLTVIDIDVGPGKLGWDSWQAAIEGHGEPDTLTAKTGGGGYHACFLYNSALKTASNVLGKGVDCRNDRGYIVAAPSRHRSGNTYQWLEWGKPLVALPAHLAFKRETRGRPRKDDLYHGRYTLTQVTAMLESVPADDRDLWRSVGIILGREFKRAEEAWVLYCEWAAKYDGQKGRGHDEIMHQAFYDLSAQTHERELSMGTIVKAALEHGWAPTKGEVPVGAFVYYGPGNNYLYRPTGTAWIAAGVDSVCSPVNVEGQLRKASQYIRDTQPCTSMTNDPGIDEDYMKGFDCRNGELIPMTGSAIFNTYRRPTIDMGDAQLAGPFVMHCRRLFHKPGDADQFLNYMAHRVQKPWEKPRFALMIAGGQGTGKDTAVEFCCPAIGGWNVANIEPSAFESNYNDFASATLIRINEASNLHEMSKWAFNERTKVLIAGTPDTCRINPKYGEQFDVKMHCGVVITTNNLATGIFIPPDDRRYDVIACAEYEEMGLAEENARRTYFSELWEWFHADGGKHVAAFLHERDLATWSPNNGQRKTAAHRDVIQINSRGDDWLDDILDEMGYPDFLRSDWLHQRAVNRGEKDFDVRKKIGATLSRFGYTRYENPNMKDGRWKVGTLKFVVYIKRGAPLRENIIDELNKQVITPII